MDKLYIIKIGGNIIDDEKKLSSFLQSFALVEGQKILVHGGGKIATSIGDKLGIESKYVDGRRITDAATIDLVTMVYAGLINKKIVASLQSFQCNAFGLSGADGNLIPATKRGVQNYPLGAGGIDYGFVGDIDKGKMISMYWDELLQIGFTPVVSPITHDGKGQLLNTNADTISQEIATVLCKFYEVSLIYSFEKSGVLLDVNDENSVIPIITPSYYSELKAPLAGVGGAKIFAGMIPKLDNAFAALNSGVTKVIIGKAENLNELIAGTSGTTIQASPNPSEGGA
jgi:acetylglutamate kinase